MKRRFGKRMLSLIVALLICMSFSSVMLASAAPLPQEPELSIQSVTGITTILTFGQKVTAIAVEYPAIVDPGPIEDPENLDMYTVKDSWYDFRFDAVAKITSDIRNRTITRMYTNDEAATIPDGVSKPGRFVIIELSPLDYGGNTVRTNPASSSYIKIMTGTTDMQTQVVQNKAVLTTDGEVLGTPTVYRPSAWLDPLADQFLYGDCVNCQQANAQGARTNLPYYYYIPPNLEPGHKYAMVVILPGQGMGYYPTTGYSATGHNEKVNVVADIPATAWMQPAWKGTDEPVIVLAPQSRRTGANYEATAALGLMDQFIAAHPEVDTNRLYFSTVSYGSTTAWAMMQQRPGFFTAGLLTGGFAVSAAQATAIATARPLTPIYITHGLYDPLLRIATTGYYSRDRLRAAYVATGLVDANGAAALIPFLAYDTPSYFNQVIPAIPGYAEPDNHAVMGPTYTDTPKLTWLLSQVKCTVKFDLNGGNSAPIADQKVMAGDKIVQPADPSRTGYTFTGWYLNEEMFDFNTPITGDITLVAHWKAIQSIDFPAITDKTFADPPFNLNATASSGLTVSYSATGNCTVSGDTVSLTGAGSCTIIASQPGDDIFNPAPDISRSFNIAPAVTSLSVSPVTVQYSDLFTLQAVVNPASANGDTATGSVAFFIDGTSVGSNVIDANGTAFLSFTGGYATGSYNVTASFTSTNANFIGSSSGPVTLTVTQEDAIATYSGDMLAFTASGGPTANVLLRATVLDSNDGYAGDIRNATVTFKEGATTLCGPLPVALIDASTTTGTASCAKSLGLGAHTIDVYVGNYYTGNTFGVVEVAQPTGSFITGGGFLMIGTSGGKYSADTGSRSNFGFNVNYKNMKSVQGHVNIIFRAGGHTYQIKSTAIDSLGIAFKTASGSACSSPVNSTCFGLADFRSKANLMDVTNPLAPISLGGNLTLQVSITDKGEPGSSDTIAFTLWSGNDLIYSSQWNGLKTMEQILGGGNLIVH